MQRIELPNGGWWVDRDAFVIKLVIDFEAFVITKRNGAKYTVRPVFSWKRAHQPVKLKTRTSISRTPQANKWAKAAAEQLRAQRPFSEPLPKDLLLNAQIVSYMHDARSIDASNLYQGPEDVMQACQPKCRPSCKMHAGIIEDDSAIESHDFSRRFIDRERPRVEITLTPFVALPEGLEF